MLKKMETKPDNFFADAKKEFDLYVRDRIWLFKLQAGEKSAFVASKMALLTIFSVLVFFFLFFLGILSGFLLSSFTGSYLTGFGIITGIYLMLILILFYCRKSLQKRMVDYFIRLFFANIKQEADENA